MQIIKLCYSICICVILAHLIGEFADDLQTSMYNISTYTTNQGICKTANSTNRSGFKFGSLSGKLEMVCGLWAIVLQKIKRIQALLTTGSIPLLYLHYQNDLWGKRQWLTGKSEAHYWQAAPEILKKSHIQNNKKEK